MPDPLPARPVPTRTAPTSRYRSVTPAICRTSVVHAQVEGLERRRLLAGVAADPGESVLAVPGTPGDDVISINVVGGIVFVVVNSVPTSQLDSLVSAIQVSGEGGADRITVLQNTDNPVTISGGDGNDTLVAGDGTVDLASLTATVTLDGGADTDSLHFDDRGSSANTSYRLDAGGVQADQLPRHEFLNAERLLLDCADGSNAIDVLSVGPGTPVTVNGNGGADLLQVAPVGRNLAAIQDDLRFVGGDAPPGAIDALVLDNTLGPAAAPGFQVTSANIATGGPVDFGHAGLEAITIRGADAADDSFSVVSSSFGTSLTLIGNAGDDTFTVADVIGSLALIGGPVQVSGGTGDDGLVINDSTPNLPQNYAIQAGQVITPGLATVGHSGLERLRLEASGGPNVVGVQFVNAGVPFITVNTNGGDDSVTATLGADSTTALVVDGGTGSGDAVHLEDGQTSAPSTWLFNALSMVRAGFAGLTYQNVELPALSTGSAADTITVDGTVTPARVNAGPGDDTLIVQNIAGGPVTFDDGPGSDDLNVTGVSTVRPVGPRDLDAVNIGAGSRVELAAPGGGPAGATLVTRSLSVAPGGTLDVGDGAAVIDYAPGDASPIVSVAWLAASGFAGGSWAGTGLVSSAAAGLAGGGVGVGFAESNDLFTSFPTTWAGRQVDATAVLIRYTLYGDATLDRRVDIADFSRLASNFNTPGRPWARGNFNFDNVVDIADFAALAGNFNRSITGTPVAAERFPRVPGLFARLLIEAAEVGLL